MLFRSNTLESESAQGLARRGEVFKLLMGLIILVAPMMTVII